jgi:hypothetical protein
MANPTDRSGERAEVEPVTFGYRGAMYEVELDERGRRALETLLERYIPTAIATGQASDGRRE